MQTFAGGKDECQDIPLSKDDLLQLVEAVKKNNLPNTRGFFFGESDGSEKTETLAILAKAIEWQAGFKDFGAEGGGESRDVVYRASW